WSRRPWSKYACASRERVVIRRWCVPRSSYSGIPALAALAWSCAAGCCPAADAADPTHSSATPAVHARAAVSDLLIRVLLRLAIAPHACPVGARSGASSTGYCAECAAWPSSAEGGSESPLACAGHCFVRSGAGRACGSGRPGAAPAAALRNARPRARTPHPCPRCTAAGGLDRAGGVRVPLYPVHPPPGCAPSPDPARPTSAVAEPCGGALELRRVQRGQLPKRQVV